MNGIVSNFVFSQLICWLVCLLICCQCCVVFGGQIDYWYGWIVWCECGQFGWELLWCKVCFYWQCSQFGYLMGDVVCLWIEFLCLCYWVENVEVWCGIGVGIGYLLLIYCVVGQIGIYQCVLELVCVV